MRPSAAPPTFVIAAEEAVIGSIEPVVSVIDLRGELERLHGASFGWAMCCCGHRREEAEDVLQTSYLKVLDGSARFAGGASFKTFLFAVIRRTAAERRRRELVRGGLLARWLRLAPAAAVAEPLDLQPSARAARLRDALARLPHRQQEVLRLVFQHELPIAEAAAVLGVGVGSARTHYERGKRRLRELLGDER
ncbi:MAG TPA: sigma-70 family RNA polymerase sigma factor [Thermoanaerobaculia bacterium]|nr:sigma-70 family RNA polymerase sigma factor [Thermoanaerobaculia bacterium]